MVSGNEEDQSSVSLFQVSLGTDQIEASESEASPSNFSTSASMSSSSENLLEVGTGSSFLTVVSRDLGASLGCGLVLEEDLFAGFGVLGLFSFCETLVADCEDEVLL